MEEKDEDSNVDSDKEYEVEKIVNSRMIQDKRQYFIKWVGYSHKANTWVPVQYISADEAIADYWKNRDGFIIPPEDRTGDEIPIPLSKSPKKRKRTRRIKPSPGDDVFVVKPEDSDGSTTKSRKKPKIIELGDSDDDAPLAESVDVKDPKWLDDPDNEAIVLSEQPTKTEVSDEPQPLVKRKAGRPKGSRTRKSILSLADEDIKPVVEDAKPHRVIPKLEQKGIGSALPKFKKSKNPQTSVNDPIIIPATSQRPAISKPLPERHLSPETVPTITNTNNDDNASDDEENDDLWGSEPGSETHDALFDPRPNTGYMEKQFEPQSKGFLFRSTRTNHLSDFLVSSRFRLPNVELAVSICRVWDISTLCSREEGKDAFKTSVKFGKVLIYVPSAVQRGSIRPDIDAQTDATALFYLLTECKAAITEDVQDHDIRWVFIHASQRSNLHSLRDLDHLRKRVGSKPPSFFLFGRSMKKDKSIKGKYEDIIRRTWDDGIVITFTAKAILNSPKVALALFRQASDAAPFISMFLHCGLVAKGGLLSWTENMFPASTDEQEKWQTIGAVVSTLIESHGATIMSPNITKTSKAFESFPADKDVVYLQELSNYDHWAPSYLANDQEVDVLVNMMKDLRVKHPHKRRWIVLVNEEEKALIKKREMHGIEAVDIQDFYADYT